MSKISLIVPCLNEEQVLPVFYKELSDVMRTLTDYSYEVLFIDDGSSDNTLKVIKGFASEDKHVKYISFSRNYGKEAAMYAGFCNVTGDYTAVLDADMQDPPSLLPEMIKILEQGEYDSVATRRVTREGEPPIRSWFAHQFYKLINKISDVNIVDGARDFRLMKRSMVDAIISVSEYNRFTKGIYGWIGFKTYWLPYENVKRAAGETKWSMWGLAKYALDGIVNFSTVPLNIASWSGIVMTLVSFLCLIFVIVRKLIFDDPVAGWASQVCIIIFIGGIQLFCMGIMGRYLAKLYVESKHRPHYIVAQDNLTEKEETE